jgi:hypothetical protein
MASERYMAEVLVRMYEVRCIYRDSQQGEANGDTILLMWHTQETHRVVSDKRGHSLDSTSKMCFIYSHRNTNRKEHHHGNNQHQQHRVSVNR